MSVIIKDLEMPNGCGDCPFCSCVANDKGRAEFQCEIFFVYSAEVIYVTDIIAKGEIPSFCPLAKVPDSRWIPIKSRPMDDEEREFYKEYYEYAPEDNEDVIYSNIPDNAQEVLTCSKWGHVSMDTFYNDYYGCYFEENGDMDGIVAWMPMPEPYKAEGSE